ncbi:MAG: hypothetical protein ACHQIO_22105, partial [Nevskiales bacterium]
MPRLAAVRAFFAVSLLCSAALQAAAAPGSGAGWAQTLERIATGVVTIQIDATRAFDTEWN